MFPLRTKSHLASLAWSVVSAVVDPGTAPGILPFCRCVGRPRPGAGGGTVPCPMLAGTRLLGKEERPQLRRPGLCPASLQCPAHPEAARPAAEGEAVLCPPLHPCSGLMWLLIKMEARLFHLCRSAPTDAWSQGHRQPRGPWYLAS